MLNKIILIGRLTDDPELRYTANGTAVCNFTLAVQRPFKNREGDYDADFVDIVVWRKQAETCANHLGKGRLVAVDGRLQIRTYETDEGYNRRVSEVVANDVRFLEWPDDNKRSNNQKQSNQQQDHQQIDEEELDVPF
ncbi:single-stranded DNA-binding protein [Halanaerobacter jeridensis]|uniref:Single-stranded DNA-binding protein n=1 Tax=Halanaerobacter jeridensis TaxID=706427 RepID=A0A938XXS2_9FIRM|nr:single-stranded DNA-binding protein [Halanaerobacter jeridensis]MBM7557612.1 single-strand DNA-binding protein [Halanaerobacter jeridensis]